MQPTMSANGVRGGAWPGQVVLRRRWAKAHARPWNDELPAAGLRIERGGAEFAEACFEWLTERGCEEVLSVPVHPGSSRLWTASGFSPRVELHLLARSLADPIPAPHHAIRAGGGHGDWTAVTAIDNRSFDRFWRVGRLGLADAAAATPRSRLLVADVAGEPIGFVIAGISLDTGYLQRMAVDPAVQGRGIGRSLVRAALRWARRRGARTMLLNTQLDNRAATALYRSEGFEILPERLTIYGRRAETTP